MCEHKRKLDKRIVTGAIVAGSGVLYLKVISPALNIHIPCPFYHVTGLYCPGCGMTRASLSLLDGDLVQAFRYNNLVFILLPLFVIYYLLVKHNRRGIGDKLLLFMLFLTIIFGVLRNVPLFSFLSPTSI